MELSELPQGRPLRDQITDSGNQTEFTKITKTYQNLPKYEKLTSSESQKLRYSNSRHSISMERNYPDLPPEGSSNSLLVTSGGNKQDHSSTSPCRAEITTDTKAASSVTLGHIHQGNDRAPSTDMISHYRSTDGNVPQQTLKGSFSLYKAIQTWRIPLLPETHLAFARIK